LTTLKEGRESFYCRNAPCREQPRQKPATPPYAAGLDPEQHARRFAASSRPNPNPLTPMEAHPAAGLSGKPVEGHVALARSIASGLPVGAGAVALTPAKAGGTPYPGKGMA